MRISDWSSDVCSSDLVMILAPSDRLARIDADMLPAELVRGGTDILPHAESITAIPLKEARENFEREYLRIQINRFSGNISRTASFIGMERSALPPKLQLLGLTDNPDGEGGGEIGRASCRDRVFKDV